MRRVKLVLFFAVNLIVLSSAHAADALAGAAEAGFTWRLGFGAGAVQPGYGLTLGYRSADPDGPSGRLLELDVSGHRALARLAGLPLGGRSYRAEQNDLGDGASPAPTPWYARQWVWWTMGGLAATLAVTGGDGSIEYNSTGTTYGSRTSCTGVQADGDGQEVCTEGGSVVSTNDDGDLCAAEGWGDDIPDGCVPGSGFAAREPRAAFASRLDASWLDAGTGGMGDLVARRPLAFARP